MGTYLKVPHCPIWTICSESHFTVLFSAESDERLLAEGSGPRRFDLYYYDGLGCMDDVIRLTLGTRCERFCACTLAYSVLLCVWRCTADLDAPVVEHSLPSPLEQTLRTKWSQAAIDWNGAERLL